MENNEASIPACPVKNIGIAADHGGYDLKEFLLQHLRDAGYTVTDYGNTICKEEDDYPDYILPLARAVAAKSVWRGLAVCGSGVGATIAANKVKGTRACLVHDSFSAHQGVEDDDMNLLCLGGRVIGQSLAWELVQVFLAAEFSNAERHLRRIEKVREAENTINKL